MDNCISFIELLSNSFVMLRRQGKWLKLSFIARLQMSIPFMTSFPNGHQIIGAKKHINETKPGLASQIFVASFIFFFFFQKSQNVSISTEVLRISHVLIVNLWLYLYLFCICIKNNFLLVHPIKRRDCIDSGCTRSSQPKFRKKLFFF